MIPISRDGNAGRRKRARSCLVAFCLVLMLATVEFNGEFGLLAVEIEDVTFSSKFHWMLTAKFGIVYATITQQHPEQLLSVRLLLPQLAGEFQQVVGDGNLC